MTVTMTAVMTTVMTAVITGNLSPTSQKPKLLSIICRLIKTFLTAAMTAVITGSLSPTLQNQICSVLYVDSSRHV